MAFGQRDGDRLDPFLVGLATLGLLTEAAEAAPVLCLVDDLQWLDRPSASTLEFAARRLRGEPIGFVLSRRGAEDVALIAADELASLEETAHLLRSPKNAARLLTALQRALAGSGTPRTVDELRREFGLAEEPR